jgi:hypothetical protein
VQPGWFIRLPRKAEFTLRLLGVVLRVTISTFCLCCFFCVLCTIEFFLLNFVLVPLLKFIFLKVD